MASIFPNKAKVYQVRLTVGGDRLKYIGDTTTRCVILTITKLFLNSVISNPDGRLVTIDLKDFYYNTPMKEPEYMQLLLAIIPQDIIDQYKLQIFAQNRIVYVKIRKGIPGLKQADKLANDLLTTHFAKFGYFPIPRTASLWKHNKKTLMITLVVDDFGVKFTKIEDAQHLIGSLKKTLPHHRRLVRHKISCPHPRLELQ